MLKNSLYSVSAILFCLLLGKGVEFIIPLLPASLYGMILFTFLLHIKVFNADKIKPVIEWALANMGVCFVPAGVGIINQYELIKQHGIALVSITFITTFFLLSLVGLFYQHHLNNLNKNDIEKVN